MMQKLQRVIIGVLLTVFLAIGFSTPAYAQTVDDISPKGYLYRINVSSPSNAKMFYGKILGMKEDPTFRVCSEPQQCWLEFLTGKEGVKIGTWVNREVGTGKGVITIVVKNVDKAKAYLENQKVDVGEVQSVGKGVRLAFFSDFDGNRLAIRDENVK